MLSLQAARLALQQQLDDAPLDGSALGVAATALKLEALTEENIRMREENAAMVQEKASLHERIKIVKKTGACPCVFEFKTQANVAVGTTSILNTVFHSASVCWTSLLTRSVRYKNSRHDHQIHKA